MGQEKPADTNSVSRTPFAWRDDPCNNPVTSSPPHILDRQFKRLAQSATFMGMLHQTPELQSIPASFAPMPRTFSTIYGLYSHKDRQVLIHELYKSHDRRDMSMLKVVAHEYRHAWQDCRNILVQDYISLVPYHLIHSRVIEGDAFIFADTVAREVFMAEGSRPSFAMQNPSRTFNALARNAVSEDMVSGALQNRMFEAYMMNLSVPDYMYDLKFFMGMQFSNVRRNFFKAASTERTEKKKRSKEELVERLTTFGSMPILRGTELQERHLYICGLDLPALVDSPEFRRRSLINQTLLAAKWARAFVLNS